MSQDHDSLREDYHINTSYTQPSLPPLQNPKVRTSQTSGSSLSAGRKPPAAVPATPRMLRNSSGNFFPPSGSTPSSSAQAQRHLAPEQLVSPQRLLSNDFKNDQSINSPAYRSSSMNSPLNNKKNTGSSHSPPKLPPLNTQQPDYTPTTARLLPPASVDHSKQQLNDQQRQPSPSRSPSYSKKATQPQQFHRRSIGDWDFVKTVGAGSMGKVKLAKHRITNEVCAIKIVPRAARLYARAHANDPPPATSQEALARKKEYEKEAARDRRTIREASLGRILYHPYICRLFEVKVMSNHYYMLFEYVSGGQMLDYIVSHGSLKERHARKFARGIGSALDYLHKNNVVHRDLKIENIMISKSGDIKIIDFGLSNMYSFDALLKTYCGSLYFAAPELLSAHPYIGPEVDVWSFGVVLYVLVCGKVPFDDQSVSVLHEKIKKGKVEYPDFLSTDVVSLLSRMLVVNPNKRAHLSEVLAHPWMTKGYEGAPQSFVPHRVPLSLPLDQNVVQEIVRLEFGLSEEHVNDELSHLINSKLYRDATQNWQELASHTESHQELHVDPRMAFHPLISIYYLVEEMLKRKKTRDSIVDIPVATAETVAKSPEGQLSESPKQETAQPQDVETASMTPNPPPVLTFPEAAHTSPIHISSPIPEKEHPQIILSDAHGNEEVIQQQSKKQHDDGKGFNSILRKFSQRRSHSTRRPVAQTSVNAHSIGGDDATIHEAKLAKANLEQAALVRRVGSMKLTKTPVFGADDDKTDVKSSKSHNRTVSAYTAGPPSAVDEDVPPLPTPMKATGNQRKFHPTARAKSVGHRRDPNAFVADDQATTAVPPIPADFNDDAFFDDITLDEFSAHSAADKATLVNSNASQHRQHLGSELSQQQILQEAAKAPAGTMPSIEYPRSVFLKGLFSVQTTSTKPLPVIRADIISVLTKLGVDFSEVRGGFVCVHTPSIKQPIPEDKDDATALKSNQSSSEYSAEQSKASDQKSHGDNNSLGDSWNDQVSTPGSKTHRRKFSIGGSILGYRRKTSASGAPAIPNTPVAATAYGNILASPVAHQHGNHGDFDSSASLDSLNNGHGGSDMLISSRIEQNRLQTRASTADEEASNDDGGALTVTSHDRAPDVKAMRTPLKFEIHIVKVPLVGLYGVHFKKVGGNSWMYKTLAGQILKELKL